MNSSATLDPSVPPVRNTGIDAAETVKLIGRVSTGRGLATVYVESYCDELQDALGERVVKGSLNVLLKRPVMLRSDTALKTWFARQPRFDWPGRLNGVDVWIQRWSTAPLHVMELLCTVHLRTLLNLSDGDEVELEIRKCDTGRVSHVGWVTWFLFWCGRTGWTYEDSTYRDRAQKWSEKFGATQMGTNKGLRDLAVALAKMLARKIPGARWTWRHLRGHQDAVPASRPAFHFERARLDHSVDPAARSLCQIRNLLNYTKTSGALYSAARYPAGYHTLNINGHHLEGQRNPAERLKSVPFDFNGKTVLDIGCNQGGMLFQLPGITWGIGVDYDPHMINVANRIREAKRLSNLGFYVMNLEKDPLDLIEDFMPESKVDIVFLLAVCGWLENWQQVISWCKNISDSILYETTGALDFQEVQIRYLKKIYKGEVMLLAERSEDDPHFKNRKLLYCGGGRHGGGRLSGTSVT